MALPIERLAAGQVGAIMPRRATAPDPTEFCVPMQPRIAGALPEGKEWIYEIKWDGYRAIAMKVGDDVQLLSRNEKNRTDDFPEVINAVRSIPAETAILDGEIVAIGKDGRPSFQALQQHRKRDVATLFYAFDLLYLNGKDLRDTPLSKRKAALSRLIDGTAVRESPALPATDPRDLLAHAHQIGLEGIVAKRRDSPYLCGDEADWVKVKTSPVQEFVVGGYIPPLTAPQGLILGYFEAQKLICCGRVRAGFTTISRGRLAKLLKPHATSKCPFDDLSMFTRKDRQEMRWVRPRVVVQVAFVNWTQGNVLRHAIFKGVRDDKKPTDVGREA